jgi:A/G-specific adenine glycosylase
MATTSSPARTDPAFRFTPAAQRALARWAAGNQRDLPWRRTRDPWAVLVSEVMLQQTQVERVAPRWQSFVQRFPTPGAAAAAGAAAVVDEWAGLGYNRRAVALHRAAVACVEHHDGQLPDDLDGLLSLSGVGPYTARAVLAFAHDADVGILDTNVGRVLARLAGRRLVPREAQVTADAAVPKGQGWAWNQSMLDLGATVCTARRARCEGCPLRRWCAWRATGPDPAIGSASVSGGQSSFAGSDRQGRGRLVNALRDSGAVTHHELPAVAGWPDDPVRARRVAASLVVDGLAADDGQGGLGRP